jgi:hypothetical protein
VGACVLAWVRAYWRGCVRTGVGACVLAWVRTYLRGCVRTCVSVEEEGGAEQMCIGDKW